MWLLSQPGVLCLVLVLCQRGFIKLNIDYDSFHWLACGGMLAAGVASIAWLGLCCFADMVKSVCFAFAGGHWMQY